MYLDFKQPIKAHLMKSLLTQEGYTEIKERLHRLNENSTRKWGKMSVGQMCWHCQYPLKLSIENKANDSKGNWLIKTFFKKSMYSDKPWRKNLPTAPQLKTTEDKKFDDEHPILLSLLDNFYALRERDTWYPHPTFGTFTKEQWGQMQYKHLDHHLTQFGV